MLEETISVLLFNVFFIIIFIISIISLLKRVNHIAILMTTILWGIVPWPYYYLELNLESVLMITFIRVLIASIFGFILIFSFILFNKVQKRNSLFEWFQFNYNDFKRNIKSALPNHSTNLNYKSKKMHFYYIIYYFLLGFSYFFSILFYFLSYNFLGVIFSAIINTVGVTIIIAIYNMLRKYENLNSIKISYLITLFIAGILTIISAPLIFSAESTIFGVISLILTIIFWFLFIIFSGIDDFTEYEKERILSFKDKSTNFQLVKSLIKVSFFFLFSLIILILFVVIYPLFPIKNIYLTNDINKFIEELQYIPYIFQNYWTWAIGVNCTIIPYLVYFQSQNNWPSRSLRWDQWISILSVFEPMASIFIGLFIGDEINYDLFLLTIAMILMIIVMLLRYYHEKHCIKSIIFMKIKHKKLERFLSRLKYNSHICEIMVIAGEYDIVIKTYFPTFYTLKNFIDKLKQLECVIEVNHHIEFELKRK